MDFRKIWVEQTDRAEDISSCVAFRKALDDLIGERCFIFLVASAKDPNFAAAVPASIAVIRRLFKADQFGQYLDHLKQGDVGFHSELESADLIEQERPGFWLESATLSTVELLRVWRTGKSFSTRAPLGSDVLDIDFPAPESAIFSHPGFYCAIVDAGGRVLMAVNSANAGVAARVAL
jgi:hypothetical protein